MNPTTDWQFGFTQVVEIVVLVLSAAGAWYGVKRSNEKNKERIAALEIKVAEFQKETNEKFIHARNSKKANIQVIMDTIKANREEVEKKEEKIYNRMEEVRKEQKEAHGQLNIKMDNMNTKLDTVSMAISQITGYFQAKKESGK